MNEQKLQKSRSANCQQRGKTENELNFRLKLTFACKVVFLGEF